MSGSVSAPIAICLGAVIVVAIALVVGAIIVSRSDTLDDEDEREE